MINHIVTGVVRGNNIVFCSLLASHAPSAVELSDTKSHQHSSEGWAMTAATAFLIQQGAAQVTRPVCRCCAKDLLRGANIAAHQSHQALKHGRTADLGWRIP